MSVLFISASRFKVSLNISQLGHVGIIIPNVYLKIDRILCEITSFHNSSCTFWGEKSPCIHHSNPTCNIGLFWIICCISWGLDASADPKIVPEKRLGSRAAESRCQQDSGHLSINWLVFSGKNYRKILWSSWENRWFPVSRFSHEKTTHWFKSLFCWYILFLAGGWATPLKIWKSVGMTIPNIWKNKSHVPNHQPVFLRPSGLEDQNRTHQVLCSVVFYTAPGQVLHHLLHPGILQHGCHLRAADWDEQTGHRSMFFSKSLRKSPTIGHGP